MAKKTEAPSADLQEEHEKLAVIVDQDGFFLRIERGGVELEEDQDFELYEEVVEKAEAFGTPPSPEVESVPEKAELDSGDEVTFTPRGAEILGSPTGEFIGKLSEAEVKVRVNGEEQVVGVELLQK